MMKGGGVEVGDEARFSIGQDETPSKDAIAMPAELAKRLKREKLMEVFEQQTPSRKKEVYRYLLQLKTEESLQRNIDKVVLNLRKRGEGTPRVLNRAKKK
jgi:uncharacterized protein YdeI (YjbR/CyaY-like superfamily)